MGKRRFTSPRLPHSRDWFPVTGSSHRVGVGRVLSMIKLSKLVFSILDEKKSEMKEKRK